MFITHPSVRIRGTEHNFTPVQCMDPQCSKIGPVHMHCPFCIKLVMYMDPVILKAHYRVKHVDKGIEFAGLKILRCCEQCDIVGAIKGEKKFKGSHWHCYKCKNGFGRRDEAVKHYKTHFRNPHTTFQIQITQEVNIPLQYYNAVDTSIDVPQGDIRTVSHPDANSSDGQPNGLNNENDSSFANGRHTAIDVEMLQVPVAAANETVVGTTELQAIMIIEQSDQVDDSRSGVSVDALLENESQLLQEKDRLLGRINKLEQQIVDLEMEKEDAETRLKAEVEQLKMQVYMQSQEIESLQKREEELQQQLSAPIDNQVAKLLTSLQAQHTQLLHQQLLQIHRQAIPTVMAMTETVTGMSSPSNMVTVVLNDAVGVTDGQQRIFIGNGHSDSSDGSQSTYIKDEAGCSSNDDASDVPPTQMDVAENQILP